MNVGEIAWRVKRAMADRVSQCRPPGDVPKADESAICLPPWPAPPSHSADLYLQAGQNVLAGRIDVYGNWVQVGSPDIDWNRDPIGGVRSPLQHGKDLDYRDSRLVGSARDVWEINRHFQLVRLAQAWAVSGDETFRDGARNLIASWLKACPYPMGINWVSALEHGIRLINWYLAARLLQLDSSRIVDGWLESIYRHCDFIWKNQSRYSSANNHLIGEMAGLYVASCAWRCWPASEEWRRQSKRVLEEQARRQVTADGVSREQTVGYQIFVLQFLILAGMTGEREGDKFSADYWHVVQEMIGFLRSVADSGGHLPNFGDSDDGMAFMLSVNARQDRLADLLAVDGALSASTAYRHLTGDTAADWLLSGLATPAGWVRGAAERKSAFPEGGYFVLGSRFGETKEVSLVFDAAPLGYLSIAAHGHADCLSFVLSLSGEQILIDPGTYCYHSDALWRDYFRSTGAHNTVRVDGIDQSEMGGPFMWLRKARPTVEVQDLGAQVQRIRARHDGYERLSDPVTHTRDVIYDATASVIVVTDEIAARAPHLVERFWHFSDGCTIVAGEGEHSLVVSTRTAIVEIEFDGADCMEVHSGSTSPRAGWISHAFGARSPTTTVIVKTHIPGSTSLRSSIRWRFR